MGIIGGELGYHLLRRISADGETGYCDGSAYEGVSKLETLVGRQIWEDTKDKVVIDFGCGDGVDAVEVAERGAKRRGARPLCAVLQIVAASLLGPTKKPTSYSR
jgi:hypothetical protein